MIEKVTGYKVGEQFFPTIKEAQFCELEGLLDTAGEQSHAEFIIEHKDKVLDILTMKPTSKPRARKINGGRKVRKSSLESPRHRR